jgi:23S rRNA pseudouridine1911/1915/1917 synthase
MLNSNIIKLKVSDYPIQNGRIDKWIIEAFSLLNSSYPEDLKVNIFFSRTKIKDLILSGNIKVDGVQNKNPSYKINPKNEIIINLPKIVEYDVKAENIPINIVFEDEHLLVIDKEQNFVVHPSPGHNSGTLVNALLYHCEGKLSGIGGIKRPGIVHRLDKDTSGLMLVAKTEIAHISLSDMFKNHSIERNYQLLVWNVPDSSGLIDQPIGRSKFNRKKMAINLNGKKAVTYWTLLQSFSNLVSLISCKLETGRTHQIRVHMSSIGHSLIGDKIYGGLPKINKKQNITQKNIISKCKSFSRQALHSKTLTFQHPISKKKMHFDIDLPNDIRNLINSIK